MKQLKIKCQFIRNILARKGIDKIGQVINRVDEGIVRADYGNKMDFQCCLIL